ncbi:MAG: branched-chain amino acid ABC transporter permease [Rhodospirillales bacterium]|nr:branched-chain amino acid ABC transporter permease [Rhodospirillales bacterium]
MKAPLGLAAAVVAAAALPLLGSDYAVGIGLSLAMWVALTQSWVLISGMAGYVSLGHVVFYGTGAYVMVLAWQQYPPWLAVLAGGIAAGVLALAIGWPVLRVRGPSFVILTFGVAELVKYVVVNVEGALGRFGRVLFGGPDLQTLYWAMLGLAVAASVLTYVVRRSRFGGGLIAIREDEDAAEAVGIPAAKLKLAAFALSAVIPGMVGAIMVMRSTYFEPLQVFSPVVSFTIVTMAVIGGSDDAPGPLFGAAFLVVLAETLWSTLPEAYMIAQGALLIAFVLFAPDGIHGRLTARRARSG